VGQFKGEHADARRHSSIERAFVVNLFVALRLAGLLVADLIAAAGDLRLHGHADPRKRRRKQRVADRN
jgi:hypothetical protein